MVPILQLIVPILLSAVAIFIASFVFNVVLPFHRTDFTRMPAEDDVMDAVRKVSPPFGDYILPAPTGPNAMKDPEYKAKVERGPIMLITVMPNRFGDMGKILGMWFLFLLVVMYIAAHAASRILGYGASGRDVFHTIGLFVFAAMGLALVQNSIWYARKWSSTFKSLVDAVVYAAITGLIFAWLWP